jgi:UrcA family protein
MLASINRSALAILAAVAASPFAVVLPASAQDTDVVVRGMPAGTNMRLVSFRDLNLNLIAHRKILDDRVARAVRAVCEHEPRWDIARKEYQDCADAAWAGATPQIVRARVRAAQLAYNRR